MSAAIVALPDNPARRKAATSAIGLFLDEGAASTARQAGGVPANADRRDSHPDIDLIYPEDIPFERERMKPRSFAANYRQAELPTCLRKRQSDSSGNPAP
jgi:hypothetical protein